MYLMKIDEALYQIKQRIKMHELGGTTNSANEREKAILDYITDLQEENKQLKKQNNDLRKIYKNTINKLFENGHDELARYFEAQIDECPTFYVEPIIDYYKEYNRLTNGIKELDDMFYETFRISQNGYYSISEWELKDFTDKLKELKEEGKE